MSKALALVSRSNQTSVPRLTKNEPLAEQLLRIAISGTNVSSNSFVREIEKQPRRQIVAAIREIDSLITNAPPVVGIDLYRSEPVSLSDIQKTLAEALIAQVQPNKLEKALIKTKQFLGRTKQFFKTDLEESLIIGGFVSFMFFTVPAFVGALGSLIQGDIQSLIGFLFMGILPPTLFVGAGGVIEALLSYKQKLPDLNKLLILERVESVIGQLSPASQEKIRALLPEHIEN